MLRVHFTDADLARTRIATAPDPLWEITASLHRLQTRSGRSAHAAWYRMARERLRERGLARAVREILFPLYPRAAYFPDFLTPGRIADRLEDGLELLQATPGHRVLTELRLLEHVVGAPSWIARLAQPHARRELTGLLREYHDTVVAPYQDRMRTRFEAERALRCRGVLDGGVIGMLSRLGPTMRWRAPVLEVEYAPTVDRDLHLNGRGLTLVPSYFAWKYPVSLADPEQPPALWFPVQHEWIAAARQEPVCGDRPLIALLGRTRAAALHAVAGGATTGELGSVIGVSASSASRHATVLRDAGLITTVRHGPTVLHTLTPTGAGLLGRARPPASPAAVPVESGQQS